MVALEDNNPRLCQLIYNSRNLMVALEIKEEELRNNLQQ